MKILYIAHEGGDNFNGASRSLLTLVEHFSKENEVYVLLPKNYGKLLEELKKCNCKIIVQPYYRAVVYKNRQLWKWLVKKLIWIIYQKPYNKKVARQIAEIITKNEIDLVHSNSSVIDIGANAANIARCKHIWHFREFAQEDFNMYPLESMEKYYKGMQKKCDKIIAVSNAVAEKYKRYIDNEKIVTIYNGLNVSSYVKHEKHQSFNLLISGMINEAKGQEIALQALRKIISDGEKNDIHLYIAGKGNVKKFRSCYSDIVRNVHYLGQVKDMETLRQKMDIELVCSRAEAFGRVTVEAMLSEIPVIGSDSGGTSELIQDGTTGFLFEAGNVDELVGKILTIYNNRNLAKQMGIEARKVAIEKYSLDRHIQSVQKIYN